MWKLYENFHIFHFQKKKFLPKLYRNTVVRLLIRNSFLMWNLKLYKINQPNIYIALALPDLQFYDLPIANVSNWAKWYAQCVEINSD